MHFIISTSFACLLLCESEETRSVSSSLEILTGFPDKGLALKTAVSTDTAGVLEGY
jgi:hypothetical protein